VGSIKSEIDKSEGRSETLSAAFIGVVELGRERLAGTLASFVECDTETLSGGSILGHYQICSYLCMVASA
jgi:hypothetical protein